MFSGLVVYPVLHSLWQVGLVHMSSRIVVGIQVGLPMTQGLGPAVMGILKVKGYSTNLLVSYIRQGLVNADVSPVALWCCGHVEGSLRQYDPSFRHSYGMDCLEGCSGNLKGLGVCVAHILRSRYNNPSGNEYGVLPGIDHLGKI